jgi:protein-disulfide isomerase
VTQEPQPPLTRRERRRWSVAIADPRPFAGLDPAPAEATGVAVALRLVSAAALVVAVAIIVLNQKPAPGHGRLLFTPPTSYTADIVDGESLGRADAPVVLEVYSDFQCPICARLVQEQFATLKSELVDTGILRIQARDISIVGGLDLPNESVELATGAICAGRQNRYWTFHDFVFWNQGGENVGDHDAAFIAAVASRSGVDRTEWDGCMAGDEIRDAVVAETRVANGAGINGTPTLVLNGGAPSRRSRASSSSWPRSGSPAGSPDTGALTVFRRAEVRPIRDPSRPHPRGLDVIGLAIACTFRRRAGGGTRPAGRSTAARPSPRASTPTTASRSRSTASACR